MGTKVIATQKGFYKQFLEPGEMFEIDKAEHFSARWMEKVTKSTKGKPAAKRTERTTSKPVTKEPEVLDDLNDWQS